MTEKIPGLDLERLLPWFQANVAPVGALRGELIGHGRSNLTYRVEGDGRSWVLRRPPLAHVLPTAHDMKREFRVLSALVATDVPAPAPVALCDDPAVNDAPFYVMQYVAGFVPADAAELARRYDEPKRTLMSEELIDTLVKLHALDPEQIGLGDFGKPAGFIERQVRRFIDQLDRSRTRDLPELDELARRLKASMPAESGAAIVHGDYRLDNCVLDANGHIAAVLDWEMATLGDPLADMGMLMMYWADRPGGDAATRALPGNGATSLPGMLTKDEARGRYARLSGRDLGNLDFYVALAFFKLAVILEGIQARYLQGGTVGPGFEMIGAQVLVLAHGGLQVADNSTIASLRG
jgi:aminoglycoside phosphotransferase (APT) family kinase protein